MESADNVESFRLAIEMTGICLYVWEPDSGELTVFMPDARRTEDPFARHPDGTAAVPHAAYLRFDLKNLDTGVEHGGQAGSGESPSYEVVHRFQRENLVLNIPDDGGVNGSLGLPDFRAFAPVLQPKPALYDPVPPAGVVMRMRLTGGEIFTRENAFRANSERIHWKIDGDLHPEKKQTAGPFEGEVVWQRMLTGKGIELALSQFGKNRAVTIPLIARDANGEIPEIRLKLANLCGNPLEWDELASPPQPVIDVDFKWLYRLMELRSEFLGQYPNHLCPVPEPILVPNGNEGDLQDCFGAQAARR